MISGSSNPEYGRANINNAGIITLVKNNFFRMPLFINDGTNLEPERHQLTEYEQVILYLIEPNSCIRDAVITKTYTSSSPVDEEGNILVGFDSQDTRCLPKGRYYYTIQLMSPAHPGESSPRIQTIIPDTIFNLV